MSMSKVSRFVVWICRKFSREEIERIIAELTSILKNPNAEVKPRDSFKEDHPNYRNFQADPIEPLTEPPDAKKKLKKATR
ncbi:MAG: hypothetical protein QG657_1494 [Acidobacteriota bacterium]|nr:hypothetical protein [Acidobacteriota bacterium]